MSYIPLGALADFVPVGPHYYTVDRPNAVQIIQRGPHGMRIAADPVRTREGKIRGSGFRFWNEQQVMRPDEKWYPREKVVGLMGLGWDWPWSTPASPDITPLASCVAGAPAPPSFVMPSSSYSPAASLRQQLVEATQAACHGRQEAAQSALRGAQYFLNQLSESDRGVWIQETQKAQAYVQAVKPKAEVYRAQQEQREKDFGVSAQAWNEAYAESERRRTAADIEKAKRVAAGEECYSVLGVPDIGCLAKKHWWKVVLVAGGVLFFYGAGQGVGRGLISKLSGGK